MADHTSWVRREPIGVVGQVTPWNYPLLMMIWKIAPALAAGNTVVLKPSDTTPASSTLLAEIAQEFLPPGVLNVVCGDRDTGRALVAHKTPQMVAITGSVRAGMQVAEVGLPRPQAGAPRARRQGAGASSSTTPTSPRPPRASPAPASSTPARTAPRPPGCWCRPGIHDEFVAALAEAAKGMPTGMPDDEATYYGPLNNANQLAHVTGMVDRLPDHATIETGGARKGDQGYFYEPTVLSGLQQNDEQIQTEIFGPVMTVQKFSRRGRGAALGQRRRSTRSPRASGPRTTPGRCGCRAGSTSARSGSTPTSRSSPRCRTAASSTPATARTSPCYGLEDYTRIKHVMSLHR